MLGREVSIASLRRVENSEIECSQKSSGLRVLPDLLGTSGDRVDDITYRRTFFYSIDRTDPRFGSD